MPTALRTRGPCSPKTCDEDLERMVKWAWSLPRRKGRAQRKSAVSIAGSTNGSDRMERLRGKVIELTARDIMTRNVITVPDDATLSELVATLSEHMITGAPVVDENGKLVGVVSTTDIALHSTKRTSDIRRDVPPDFYLRGWEQIEDEFRSFSIEEDAGQVVRDIMTPVIFSVSENARFVEMADMMVGGRVHRLIVTDSDRVVGIVTTLDLLRGLRDRWPRA